MKQSDMTEVLAQAGAQHPPKAQFAAPVSSKKSSDSESSKPSIDGNLGIKGGAATPLTDASDTPHPQGGESGEMLSGKPITKNVNTPKDTPKRGRGRPRGAKNKPRMKVQEVEVVNVGAITPSKTPPHFDTPVEAIAYKKEQAEYALATGDKEEKKKEQIDEIAIEKDLLSEWLSKPELEVAEFFQCRHFHLWKDQVEMTLPSHASGRLGYYIAAFNGLRKIGYSWEQLVIVDGDGQWIGIREDLLDAFVGGFLTGIGLSKHMNSLSISRQSIDWGRKELERLPWSQSSSLYEGLHGWVADHLHVDTMRTGGYETSAKELYTAYIITTGDHSHADHTAFGKHFNQAMQEVYAEECKKRWCFKHFNTRCTSLSGRVNKCTGWKGIKLNLNDLNTLRVKVELNTATALELQKLEDLENTRLHTPRQ